ncbi:MAG: hypothetical protein LBO74_04135 [Candidatus Symbiothrix sp.]|jgi:hypothetical protein|nr:hypothetical protein [Candidatus Symbiothrix sp.]
MIRTIFVPHNDNIMLPIPKEYVGVKLEVIVFPIEEFSQKSPPSKEVTFNSISIDTRKYKFNREEANER